MLFSFSAPLPLVSRFLSPKASEHGADMDVRFVLWVPTLFRSAVLNLAGYADDIARAKAW